MCGITGLVDAAAEAGTDELTARASAMAGVLAHRGPDAHDTWVDAAAGVALGHRRLAIVDLTPTGAQPMTSADGRWVLSYNGELYNYPELRDELVAAGTVFRGTSDTEVLVEAIARWGVAAVLERANAMFALAVWDRRNRVLHLARDRFGEKPLYYGWAGRTLLFGSELRSLAAHPDFEPVVDRDALALFFRYAYVPAPRSIYRGIHKLPAGTSLALRLPVEPGRLPAPVPYWSAIDVAGAARRDPLTGDPDELADAAEEVLRDSVRDRMLADVPLGALLSGGVDSSLVTALMQASSTRPVRTFTMGFDDVDANEADAAARVAAHLGTDHTELYVSRSELQAVVPDLPTIYDEPFADASQIPTVMVSRLARRSVTVCLTGDGGDELFGGYRHYRVIERALQLRERIPRPLRALAGATSRSQRAWTGIERVAARLGATQEVPLADRARRLGGTITSGVAALYPAMMAQWEDPAAVVLAADEPPSLPLQPERWPPWSPVEQAMAVDTVTFLTDDILAKVDRASMSVSLETRVPLLDPRVYELAWRLPMTAKLDGGQGKVLLRRVLHRHVPPALVDRPKQGFGAPIAGWLRGPLRPWADELLDPDRLAAEGYLDASVVQSCWREHLAGRRDWSVRLWGVLMFEAWLASVGDGRPVSAARA